jgi:hypothetical protein
MGQGDRKVPVSRHSMYKNAQMGVTVAAGNGKVCASTLVVLLCEYGPPVSVHNICFGTGLLKRSGTTLLGETYETSLGDTRWAA